MSTAVWSRRALVVGTLPALALFALSAKASSRRSVRTLLALRTRRGADGETIEVSALRIGGTFRWYSQSIAMDDGVLTLAPSDGGSGRWVRDTSGRLDVRWFGAAPNASAETNTAAFAAASAVISRQGGGTILIPPGIYRVGVQSRAGGSKGRFVPADIIRVQDCREPVAILGDGATLQAANGLRFGSFDPNTGAAHEPSMPFTDAAYRADAPTMVQIVGCSGPVRVNGLTLDGNSDAYVLGGEWGDTGRQVGGDGILAFGNTGGLALSDVRSRNHGRDGIMIGHSGLRPDSPRTPVTLTDVVCERNGRQGLSWVGGTSLSATRCKFNRTGRGPVSSAPGAGMDIEAESSVCRNGRFFECEFVDNTGVGMVADSGDTADVVFERCRFVGTTNWSCWPRKPGFAFRDCLFVGSIVQVFGSPDPALATRFLNCRFHGDPKLSPTGMVYGVYLGDLGAGDANVLMSGCDLRAVAPRISLLWSTGAIRFNSCTFRQLGKGESYPRGIFSGTNSIVSNGPVGLEGSRILGILNLNGIAIT